MWLDRWFRQIDLRRWFGQVNLLFYLCAFVIMASLTLGGGARNGRLSDAIAEYQAVLRVRPDYWEAHYDLGSAWLRTGRLEDAVTEFETVQRLRPDPKVRLLVERLRAAERQ